MLLSFLSRVHPCHEQSYLYFHVFLPSTELSWPGNVPVKCLYCDELSWSRMSGLEPDWVLIKLSHQHYPLLYVSLYNQLGFYLQWFHLQTFLVTIPIHKRTCDASVSPPYSFLCIVSISIPDFSRANSGQLAAGSAPWCKLC